MLLTVGTGASMLVVVAVVVVVAVQTPGVDVVAGATGGLLFTQSFLEQLFPGHTFEQ